MASNQELARISKKLSELEKNLQQFEEWEARTERIIEDKVFEIKAVSYLNLIVTSVLLAIAIGIILKALGF